MIVDCVADLHGFFPPLEGGDLLILAGDYTGREKLSEWRDFYDWLSVQKYRQIIYIAGNHDGLLVNTIPSQEARELGLKPDDHIEYLCDTGFEFEGIKIWGAPWTPMFCDWYFMKQRGEHIKKHWDKIPKDTDILITHGPPQGIMDTVPDFDGLQAHKGCGELAKAVYRVKPRYHVFGHIHEGYGQDEDAWGMDGPRTKYVNCAIMNENYKPVNKPIRLIL